jgi:hypothetical protein
VVVVFLWRPVPVVFETLAVSFSVPVHGALVQSTVTASRPAELTLSFCLAIRSEAAAGEQGAHGGGGAGRPVGIRGRAVRAAGCRGPTGRNELDRARVHREGRAGGTLRGRRRIEQLD